MRRATQTGNLNDANLLSGARLHHDVLTLVLLCRLVEARIKELAGMVVRIDDPAGNGRTVHMHIKDIHEDGDAPPFSCGKIKLGRNWRHIRRQHTPVGRRHDIVVGYRRRSDRIAEK